MSCERPASNLLSILSYLLSLWPPVASDIDQTASLNIEPAKRKLGLKKGKLCDDLILAKGLSSSVQMSR